jgi:proton-translocating NADH-quinone oxidoreductase chain L
MYLSILIFPFLSFFSTNIFGRYIGIFGSNVLSTFSIAFSFTLAIFIFYESAICGSVCTILLAPWINTELFISFWGFYFDAVSSLMLLVVCSVSSLVHLYATEYMSADPHQGRFMGYLSLFTGFMLILVTADNFLVMFFGWEGIGLASFLLISFWYSRIQAGKSAIKAMLVNRIGDLGLALGIGAVFLTFKSIDYPIVFSLASLCEYNTFTFLSFEFDRITVITLLLFWGALGKSAQVGLHIWLPDAMEGPTPVSALIHAATLVTAGVFLIIRCSSLFEKSQNALFILAIMGALTAFFAGTVGLVQSDLKRVIAFSTCSQLGFMVFACGLSHYSVALFHLANHALFKALLFLSAGCVIHGLLDEQDLRKMGGLLQLLPMSYTMILIGSLALVGFPFLTGFYSKDVILEIALTTPSLAGNFTHWLGCLAAFCTSFYSFRLIFLAFINDTNTKKVYIEHAHDAPIRMGFPLMVLSIGSIFWGFFSKDMIIGLGSPLFLNNITTSFENLIMIDSEFASALLKNVPFLFTIIGGLLAFLLINCSITSKQIIFSYKIGSYYRQFYTFLIKKWHFDQIGNELFIHKAMNFGYRISFQTLDKGNIEVFGAFGSALKITSFSKGLSSLQSGFIYHYSFIMIIAMLSFLTCFLILSLNIKINTLIFALVLFYSLFSID